MKKKSEGLDLDGITSNRTVTLRYISSSSIIRIVSLISELELTLDNIL